jgi:HD-GYP domain-containing protein (c-di-GMP phosphodiesterase class II)
MTSDRPYRNAMSKEAAMMELHENAGSQFDPQVVEALTTVVDRIQPAVPAQDDIRAILSAASAERVRVTS